MFRFRRFKTGEETSIGYFPDFISWLEYGMIVGYCSETRCDMHDGLPVSEEETVRLDDGEDICIPAVRLYPASRVGQCRD